MCLWRVFARSLRCIISMAGRVVWREWGGRVFQTIELCGYYFTLDFRAPLPPSELSTFLSEGFSPLFFPDHVSLPFFQMSSRSLQDKENLEIFQEERAIKA